MISNLAQSQKWWGLLITLCLVLEGVALFYQYQLNYLPCVLCIHVRMLLALLLIIAIVGWFSAGSRWMAKVCLIFTTGIWIWMLERSYQLLASERGWSLGECSMESGLPSWLALEKWFPYIFQIHEPCGYTPYLIGKISMAEVLVVMSLIFTLTCIFALVKRSR